MDRIAIRHKVDYRTRSIRVVAGCYKKLVVYDTYLNMPHDSELIIIGFVASTLRVYVQFEIRVK